ncbi:MAG: hypothetical protein ACNA77_11515 [Opitutales bacterium]
MDEHGVRVYQCSDSDYCEQQQEAAHG